MRGIAIPDVEIVGGKVVTRPRPQLKYRNTPTEVDGIKFASKREAARWSELKLIERTGEICNLERQRRFPIIINGVKIADYVSDFTYTTRSGNCLVIEDVKSPITRKNPLYRLKAKAVAALYQAVVEI